ncbi:GAF domain-containing protein [Streptomyces broussonetiae]|uniref:GAF domain-containing protein n=1 Tax=Streptomyces broussonetiae TaxID=2686304 RepID=UPI0018EED109
MDVVVDLPADPQPAEPVQVGERALRAPALGAEAGTVLCVAPGCQRLHAEVPSRPTVFVMAVSAVCSYPCPVRASRTGKPQVIDDSEAGRCFLDAVRVELPEEDGVRVHLPLLDGGDQVGVMAVTLDSVDDDDRRLLLRISGLVADLLVAKHGYSDLSSVSDAVRR